MLCVWEEGHKYNILQSYGIRMKRIDKMASKLIAEVLSGGNLRLIFVCFEYNFSKNLLFVQPKKLNYLATGTSILLSFSNKLPFKSTTTHATENQWFSSEQIILKRTSSALTFNIHIKCELMYWVNRSWHDKQGITDFVIVIN